MKKRANLITLALAVLIVAAGLLSLGPLRSQMTAQPTPAASPVTAETETAQILPDGANCTVEIRCDNILDYPDRLADNKRAWVPEDGVILSERTLALEAGDTAFDVLRRACEAADIALEFSFTPLYNSYYVEGIGNLYEFDCGEQSGWVYAVNGEYANYASSAHPLADGDTVVWRYTCEGLGADVGAVAG